MKRIALAGLFLSAFLLYVRTMHPAFQLDDSPWTTAACLSLGTQHPPGYPALTILGRLAAELPAGGIYFRLNLLAAVLAASGVAMAGEIAAGLFPGRAGLAAAVFAAAGLAVSRAWWDCAISAKGSVYLLTWLLLFGAALAILRRGRAAIPAAAGLVGVASAMHWMTAVWWIPVLAVAGRPWTRRGVLLAALLAALGASLYLELPLGAARDPSWSDPSRARGAVEMVARRSFLAQATMRRASLTWLQGGYGLLTPLREGGMVFALVALAGWAALWRDRRRAFSLLAAAPLLTLASVAILANPVHLGTGQLYLWLTDRFHLPLLGACAIAVAAGILVVRRAVPPRAAPAVWVAAALVPLLAGWTRLGDFDHSRDYLGHDYAENLVGDLRAPAVLLAEADYQSFPVWAPLSIDESAPGVRFVITNPFLNRRSGWLRLARRLPEARGLADAGPTLRGLPDRAAESRIAALVDRLRAESPVRHPSMCSYPDLRRRMQFRGLSFEVGPVGAAGRPPDEAAVSRLFARLRLRGLYGDEPHKDETAFSVLDGYGQLLVMPGVALIREGKTDAGIASLRSALRLPGRVNRASTLNILGQALARQRRYDEAEAAFREATRIEPHSFDLWTNVATACAAQGDTAEAMRLFSWVLRRDPRNRAALANLEALRSRLAGPAGRPGSGLPGYGGR